VAYKVVKMEYLLPSYEVWNWIDRYEGRVQISNRGRVRVWTGRFSGVKGRIVYLSTPYLLRINKNKWGYYSCVIGSITKKDSKRIYIHREVAKSFVIQKSIDHIFSLCNCFEKLMDMKREAISSKAIWTAKKRYAMVVHDSEGVKYDPPKLKIMGMDIIKSSTPQVIRKELKSTLPIIFDKGQAALRTFVGDVKTRFMSMPVQDISFPRGTSDIEKWVDGAGYKSRVPIHIRGAIVYNNAVKHLKKYDRLQSGDKIKFCYLKTPNPVKENVISFPSSGTLPPELGLERYIDYETQFQKSFLSPLEGITTAIGFTLEDVSNFDALFE